jgi:OmpA-OmpF porin, OOP family
MKRYLLTLLLAVTTAAFAQTGPQGYLTDSNGQIVRSGTGLCWHTGYWTPANAVEGCDPVNKPAPVGVKVTLKAETLFDFDKATIKPEGKVMLDNLIKDIRNYNLDLVVAVGFTDRIGSDAYNKKLSQRRAQAVQDYLVSHGVPTPNIYAEGKGKANPVTGDTCKGQVGKKLISCLAPDRRVVIEIIGTK